MSTSKKNIKTPNKEEKEKSYLDIINDYLLKTEEDQNFATKIMNIKQSDQYKIYEDLKIISEVAKDESDSLGPKFWQTLKDKKFLKRSNESMRDRYKSFLQHLERDDFDQILKFINYSGLYGYLIFEKNAKDGHRLLKKIMMDDEYQKPSYIHKTQEEDKTISFSVFESISNGNKKKLSDVLHEINPNYDDNSLADEIEVQIKESCRLVKKIKTEIPQQNIQQNQENDDEFLKIIKSLEKEYGKKTEQILLLLEQTSGNFQDLKDYLEKKNLNLLWKDEEDLILAQAKSIKDLNNLIDIKSIDRIKERYNFKDIKIAFEI